jgi:hypothetical protein
MYTPRPPCASLNSLPPLLSPHAGLLGKVGPRGGPRGGDFNGTKPERNGTRPERNGTHPERNGAHPERNGTHPDRGNGTHPERNGTHPEGGNGTRLAATTAGPGMGGKQGPGGKRGEQS